MMNATQIKNFSKDNNFHRIYQVLQYNLKTGFIVSNKDLNKDEYFIPTHQIRTSLVGKGNEKGFIFIDSISSYHNLENSMEFLQFVHNKDSVLSYNSKYLVCENKMVVGIQSENSLVTPILPHIHMPIMYQKVLDWIQLKIILYIWMTIKFNIIIKK